MVDYKVILDEFHIMLDEHWPYDWGAARYGCVDCSGAFVYAYNEHEMDIAHGSNAIARKYVVKLIPYSEAKIEAGMMAFKARKPGEKGYALPRSIQGDWHAGAEPHLSPHAQRQPHARRLHRQPLHGRNPCQV